MSKSEKPAAAELNLRYGPGEEALAEQLWHADGGINLSLLEVFSEVAPSGYEQDFICDALELIVELTKKGSSRREIARQILGELRDELVDEAVSFPQSFPTAENVGAEREFREGPDPSEIAYLSVHLAFNKIDSATDATAETATPVTSERLLRTQMAWQTTDFERWRIPTILGLQRCAPVAELASQLNRHRSVISFFEAVHAEQQRLPLKCFGWLPFSGSMRLANDTERAHAGEPPTCDGVKPIVFIDGRPYAVAAKTHRASEFFDANRREMLFEVCPASKSSELRSNPDCACSDSSEMECDPFDPT